MKKMFAKIFIFLLGLSAFAQSAEYSAFLAKAKEYESQKKWCHALDAYYDAMATDDPISKKTKAYDGFTKLKNSILSGNPGLEKVDDSQFMAEWKKLLIESEVLGCTVCGADIDLPGLRFKSYDVKAKKATYYLGENLQLSDRLKHSVVIVKKGYKNVYKKDWPEDFPEYWPFASASKKVDESYNTSGVYIWEDDGRYWNPFYSYWQFEYKINIVDENGKELVEPVNFIPDEFKASCFTDISTDVLELIEGGKAFPNLLEVNLLYGKKEDGFKKLKISPDRYVVTGRNNKIDKKADNVRRLKLKDLGKDFVKIPGKKIKMLKTEVTVDLYETVMGDRDEDYVYKNENTPKYGITLYKAASFCNKLSLLKNLEPVYSVNGSTDTKDWNFFQFDELFWDENERDLNIVLAQNPAANGFRLPTYEEWTYAARGGKDYAYSGSDNLDEVGWYKENHKTLTLLTAQKKPNDYGLYDMSGGAMELTLDEFDGDSIYYCGGDCYSSALNCRVNSRISYNDITGEHYECFRVVCPAKSLKQFFYLAGGFFCLPGFFFEGDGSVL